MKVSILRGGNTVVVDGVPETVDCSSLPSFIHAIQWNGIKGEIEYNPDDNGVQAPNHPIITIEPFQHLIDLWTIAHKENQLLSKERQLELHTDTLNREVQRKNHEAAQQAFFETSAAVMKLAEADRATLVERIRQLEASHSILDDRLKFAEGIISSLKEDK